MHGLHCGATPSNPIHRRTAPQPDHRRKARTPTNRKSWVDQQPTHTRTPADQDQSTATAQSAPVGESRLKQRRCPWNEQTSANNTVTCLYSADWVACVSRVPHSPQNLAVGLDCAPQDPQIFHRDMD